MASKTNPLNFQEIVTLVGTYLVRHQLISALKVSKVWNAALSPLLFREFTWTESDFPAQRTIAANAGFTTSLKII
ncbi:hypothetical protein BGZ76_005872, partial [Entomortierella beljakovae]